jgi:uncharacterized membrane protein
MPYACHDETPWGTADGSAPMSARRDILAWVGQGAIAPDDARRALAVGGALPTAGEWRRFIEQLLLWLGTVLLAAGVAFFVAYNWAALGRFAKIGLVEGLLLATLAFVVWKGLDRVTGKAALLGASVLVGALLALVGQIYQTGADTFELFAAWGLAILPWALVGRLSALWILWLAIANLAIVLYYTTFGGLFGILFAPDRLLWVLFAFDTAALVAWEALARSGLDWLGGRWAPRLLATASGGLVTALAVGDVVHWTDAPELGLPVWALWLGAAYLVYRRLTRDVYVLAVGACSVIVVVTTFLVWRAAIHEAGGLLLIGLVIIGLSAAAARWLRGVAAEEDA